MVGSVNKLRDAWIEFLGRWTWEWFGTFTFRDLIHPEAADKRFRVLVSKANRQLFGQRWAKKHLGIMWVRALEMHKQRPVLHYHALFSGVQDLRRLSYVDEWYRMAGIARIEPIRNSSAVHRYVTKYVIKGGDIDLGGVHANPQEVLQLPLPDGEENRVSGPGHDI